MRICGKYALHVSGQIYLGNDGDLTVCRIPDNVAHLLLSVETFMGNVVKRAPVLAYHGLGTLGAHFGQLRMLLDLQTPALVIGKMPMKLVDVMKRQNVDIALH